ncbi:MAG TPA: hypothetical protein HA257_10375 [Candidatus Methanoperedenaceae archaeon]|nr:hypothetical protein [Candidatus Methanoperedenaceae archaeon]
MRFNGNMLFCLLAVLFFMMLPASAEKNYVIGDQKTPVVKGDPAATYVGADKCATCHSPIYATWSKSGHRYKLNTPAEIRAVRPDLPVLDGYTWDDILFVIGGWGWKARYINEEGYIITTYRNGTPHTANQYNFEDGSWSAYNSGKATKYDCAKCHTTGAYYGGGNYQDLPGMDGNWEFRGIQCEACHGPGSVHVSSGGGKGVAIVVDNSSALCGKCHRRGAADEKIIAKGGFVDHHEQYHELAASPMMNVMRCVDCHDPHKPVHVGATNTNEGFGIKKQCSECHTKEAAAFQTSKMSKAGVRCIDCHMAMTTKSAVNRTPYSGDVRSHLFRINTDVNAVFIYTDPKDKGTYANRYITVEYACLPCHPNRDKAWAAQEAKDFHAKAAATATGTATRTQPVPAFEALSAVAALLVSMYARRR